MRLEQLSSNVYILPAHPDGDKVQPVIGAVVGREETILIDAGNSPHHAQILLGELKGIGAPPVQQLVYTHWHWDHVFGACIFRAPVVAHRLCKEKLREIDRMFWNEQILQETVERGHLRAESADIIRAGIDDWNAFKIILPAKTFQTKAALESEDYRLELTHVNSKHSSDSIVVNVLGEKIMFVADAFYPAPLRHEPQDRTLDKKVLEFMLASSCERFVHGHGEVLSRENIQEILKAI